MRFLGWFVTGVAVSAAVAYGQAPKTLMSPAQQRAFVDRYCSDCHNPDDKVGGMTLTDLDFAHPERNVDLAEKVVRRVGVSFMPPPGEDHPDPATRKLFVESLAGDVDAYAARHPYYGNPPLHRMNRAEYANSVRELLGVNIDVDEMLPSDTFDHGFDNMSDVLTVTPTLMGAYVRVAGEVSREALGDRNAAPGSVTYELERVVSQVGQVDGAPFGTRGGISVIHNFPANGQYTFTLSFFYSLDGVIFGAMQGKTQQIEVSVNGVRVALLPINPTSTKFDIVRTQPVYVPAGPQRVSAAFLKTSDGPVDDPVQPVSFSLLDLNQAPLPGLTTLPHLQELTIAGPAHAEGVAETPSRKLVFSCYPKTAAQEQPCARQILSRLATQAYRRPVTGQELASLMKLYAMGHDGGSFEDGIGVALQAILASPSFIFRFERSRVQFVNAEFKTSGSGDGGAKQETQTAYPISDLELASRLSYFLWSAEPDPELLRLATANQLHRPAILQAQVRRMLRDPRAIALSNNFASEWLHLQNLKSALPDGYLFPLYSQNLISDMREETILFFNSIVHEDRDVLTLLNGNYTFINGDLAKLYGVPDVYGNRFRRIELTDPNRFGLLGKASILTLTSGANRTSPTIRGKYVMEVFLGTPPPPPPPNVPALKEHGADGGPQTVRAILEEHRKNPTCAGCHKFMDPIGFALENFDPIGGWRNFDNRYPIDSAGKLYDGTPLNGPASLRRALMAHSDAFIGTFTESLFAYGMGRVLVPKDMPVVRSIKRYAAAHNDTFSAFVLGIVNSGPFRMRSADEATPELKRLLATRMDLKGLSTPPAAHN
jgi:Protein of unknown function (DUF1592)/Protein of unknown function (DUF1588)/Protein of unknown function (DUF1595)/Protein of unknown function (DUF1587)/Protein of unknown function (DUF1585)